MPKSLLFVRGRWGFFIPLKWLIFASLQKEKRKSSEGHAATLRAKKELKGYHVLLVKR